MYVDLLFVFLFGMTVCSFLNVCIYRLPIYQSIVWPRSYCEYCKTTLTWLENVPVISFVFLRGLCRHCKQNIALSYPAVELGVGIFFVLFYVSANMVWAAFPTVVLILTLFVASMIDLKHGIIPNRLIVFLVVVRILFALFLQDVNGIDMLLGGLAGGGSLLTLGLAGKWMSGHDSMGGGDVKLAFGIGLFLGWYGMFNALFAACLVGASVGLILRVLKKIEPFAPVPFGPFLFLGCVFELLNVDLIQGIIAIGL